MNVKISTLFFVAAMASSNLVFAGADDTKWVAQCVKDNQDQGKPVEVVAHIGF